LRSWRSLFRGGVGSQERGIPPLPSLGAPLPIRREAPGKRKSTPQMKGILDFSAIERDFLEQDTGGREGVPLN